MRTVLYLLPALLAGSDLADPPAPLAHPVHALALADLHVLAVEDADDMDAGRTGYAGEPVPRAGAASDGSSSGSSSSPPPVIPELPLATAIATGKQHACILSRGDVYCWGDNAHGALGAHRACPSTSGDATTCPLDPEIMPTLPKIAAIAAGDDMTCAIVPSA